MISFNLLVLFIAALVFYLLFSLFYGAFVEVGFSRLEASLIVFGSLLLGLVDIYLFTYGNWRIEMNVGGAVIPVMVSVYLTAKRKFVGRALLGIALVSLFTYQVTEVTTRGISSPFPLWLLPPAVASLFSLLACYRKPRQAAPLAYVTGTLGVLVGADFFHLPELLRLPTPQTVTASIGGAAIFDMVFLAGIIAVLIDSLFMARRQG
ncbi:MAG: DUF1614 domain-containing protein [Thermoplasmatota archaeon]